jgi:hypothetical protein
MALIGISDAQGDLGIHPGEASKAKRGRAMPIVSIRKKVKMEKS